MIFSDMNLLAGMFFIGALVGMLIMYLALQFSNKAVDLFFEWIGFKEKE